MKGLFPAVCCLGLSAFLTQLALMRELLSAFCGNELVVGIVLGAWMLLTGVGASLGRTARRLPSPIVAFVAAEVLIALLPIADVFLLRWLRNVVFLRGAEVGLSETAASCFVLLAPYCLVTGYALTLACHAVEPAEGRPAAIGTIYVLDNLGNVLGGVAFLVVLVQFFGHFGMLYLAGALNLSAGVFVALCAGRRRLAAAVAAALAALLAVIVSFDLEGISRRLELAGQDVIYHGHSPYGSLVVTRSAGQLNFIENGAPLFSTENAGRVEETVHYAMAQRPGARRVLLVSGGVSGTLQEILKYPVERIDYVELDPLILEVARTYLPGSLADPRIHLVNTDGRLYVRQVGQAFSLPEKRQIGNRPHISQAVGQAFSLPNIVGQVASLPSNVGQVANLPTGGPYDVVIADVPDPSTWQFNRFYTREFFAEVHRILVPGGVLSFSLGTYENYLGPELARLVGVARRTLRSCYANVLILPGGRIFFLASDGPLTADVAGRLERSGIPARVVNRGYLKGMLTPDRMAEVERATSATAPLNEDFSPVLYYCHLRYWMSQFRVRFGLFEAALAVGLLVYLARLRPVPLAVFCGGFAASALEVVLLLACQVLFGSLYQQVGLIVTVFMLGLVIGAMIAGRWHKAATVGRAGSETGVQPQPGGATAHKAATVGRAGLEARVEPQPGGATNGRGFVEGATNGRGFVGECAPDGGATTDRRRLTAVVLALAVFAACLPLALGWLGQAESPAGLTAAGAAIGLLTLLLAVLVGMEFPLAASVDFQSPSATSARLYTADYVGAGLGALLVSTLLIPVLGVFAVCFLTAGLNLAAAGVMLMKGSGVKG